MLNKINVMGRLTRDPELRYTQNQTPVASFTIACDRDIADKDGNKGCDFFDCTAWRQTGEFVSKYFRKGSMIVVSGRLQNRDWLDKDQTKRHKTEIVCESVYFGESKKAEPEKMPNVVIREKPVFTEMDDSDGSLPF